MTGYPEFNYPTFRSVADRLRSQGYEVISPAELDHPDTDWHMCMRRAIQAMMNADAVAVLDNWYDSRGARIEVLLAKELGMKVLCANTLQQIF
jgi:hypothetical protein